MPEALNVTTPSDREVVVTRDFDAPRDLVFEAWTTPDLVSRWLLGPPGWTMPVCEIDARVGGRYRYVWRHPDGRELKMGGVYREVDPPERLVSIERFDDPVMGGDAQVTMLLTESGGRTTMTMTILYASREIRDGAVATGMTDGMEQSFVRLDAILATPD